MFDSPDLFLIRHGDKLFLLFLAPWIGLLLDQMAKRKTLFRLSAACALLLLPYAFSYEFTIHYADRIIILLLGSCLYGLYSRWISNKGWKTISAVGFSIIGFIGPGFLAFLNAMSGGDEVLNRWQSGRYRVEYIRSSGFAGRAVQTYQLKRYTLIPVYQKKVDVVSDDEQGLPCRIRFEDAKIEFDRCRGVWRF